MKTCRTGRNRRLGRRQRRRRRPAMPDDDWAPHPTLDEMLFEEGFALAVAKIGEERRR